MYLPRVEAQLSVTSKGSIFATRELASNATSIPFLNPSNVAEQDNHFATSSALVTIGNFTTNYLTATGFNFDIPLEAIILNVGVDIQKRAGGLITNILLATASIRDNDVRIIKSGELSGDNKATSSNWPASATYLSYSGNVGYWGTELLPQEINRPDFGIAISARINTLLELTPRAEIGHIRMTVTYQISTSLPVTVSRFATVSKNDIVSHEWRVFNESQGYSMTLQQSKNLLDWQNIAHYTTSSRGINTFQYQHEVNDHGDIYFRLKLVSPTGDVNYSQINKICQHNHNNIRVYPVPAKDVLYLSNISAGSKIEVFNSANQKVTPPKSTNGNTVILQLGSLPKGIYFIRIDAQVLKFIKS